MQMRFVTIIIVLLLVDRGYADAEKDIGEILEFTDTMLEVINFIKAIPNDPMTIVEILTDKVIKYIFPTSPHMIPGLDEYQTMQFYAHNAFLRNEYAVKEITRAHESLKETGKHLKETKAKFQQLAEEQRQLIMKLTKFHENTHQHTMQAMHGIQEGIRTAAKAFALISRKLATSENLDVGLFIKQLVTFYDRCKQLEFLYQDYYTYVKRFQTYNQNTLIRFIAKCMSINQKDDQNLMNIINMISLLTDPIDGIFSLTGDIMVQNYIMSTRKVAPLQFMHNLFSYVILAEVRTIYVVDFAFQLSYYLNQEDTYEQEYQDYMYETGLRITIVLDSFKFYSAQHSGRHWTYDSANSKIGNNYVFFTNFMKGIVYRDKDCKSAGDLPTTDTERLACQLDNKYNCTGEIHCDTGTSSSDIFICYSRGDSDKRYDYVLLDTAETTRKCSGTKVSFKSVKDCRDCLCYCDEPYANNTNRYISMDEMSTDVEDNKIITGVRLNKYEDVITIDIQESQFDSKGYIVPNSTRWIVNKGNTYFKLINPDKLFITVGEIKTDHTRVVTGVRFHETRSGVELQMKINDYVECENVTLISRTSSDWMSVETNAARAEIDLTDLDIPTKAAEKGRFRIESFEDKNIRVSSTSFVDDGAQTVLPFFDTREVVTVPPCPIRGVGLAYKTASPDYGGYIAPYIIVADFSRNINIDDLKQNLLQVRSASKTTALSPKYVIIIVNYFIVFNRFILI